MPQSSDHSEVGDHPQTGPAKPDPANQEPLAPSWWNLLRETVLSWWRDNCARLGASLAYYSVFAIAPLLVFAVMTVGIFYGTDAAEGRIAGELEGVMGEDAAGAIQSIIVATSKSHRSSWTTYFSLGAALFGASAAFNEIRYALNIIWNVRPRPSAHWWYTIRDRLLAFGLVLLVGSLFLALMVITSVTQAAWGWLEEFLPFSNIAAGWINYLTTLVVETALFAVIFRYLPDAKISWRDVWLGAFVTALLFAVGNALIGIYFTHSAVVSAYGAAGSLAIFMLWAYYSAQIFYLGAEFTQVYARMYGSKIRPESHAESFSR